MTLWHQSGRTVPGRRDHEWSRLVTPPRFSAHPAPERERLSPHPPPDPAPAAPPPAPLTAPSVASPTTPSVVRPREDR
ncbi:hypothetical protein [Kitasatospora sp. NPDC088783]|uniref:hypothetical protein n=1 Tax=Kitasatospora sp. NPDC088783 TaxID=3364077 RepID=UPI00382481AC